MSTFIGLRMILATHTLTNLLVFSLWSFKVFKKISGSYYVILFNNLLL